MPYKDPKAKLEAMKKWRQDVMPRGYGKWLYARRKLRFDDAERFRGAIVRALLELGIPDESYPRPVTNAVRILNEALAESKRAEETLGSWQKE